MLESLTNNVFNYKKLTESEQKQRGILGRLVGVIADGKNATRNGRTYSIDLWQHVFEDPVVIEKINNRAFLGELGHPADRDYVEPKEAAICLAEVPKIAKDGKLYGVFDILNTPCGQILKTLCDYGTKIGVSSRGSGDVLGNDEVDPDTYECECWDAVLVPAVKTARLQLVKESYEKEKTDLRARLTESYKKATIGDKKIMKEKLEELNINLTEDAEPIGAIGDTAIYDFGGYWPGDGPDTLTEESDEAVKDETDAEENVKSDTESDEAIDLSQGEEPALKTADDFAKQFKQYDKETNIIFEPLEIDGKKYNFENLTFTEEPEEKEVAIKIDYSPEMVNDKNTNSEDILDDSALEKTTDNDIEANDAGSDEVLENLKEAIRQNKKLKDQIKKLNNEKAVNDIEVKKLKESLDRYKESFHRVGKAAAKVSSLEKDVQNLTEQLQNSEKTVKTLQATNSKQLTESTNKAAQKISKLTEQLEQTQKDFNNKTKQLNEQISKYQNKLETKNNAIKQYKNKCNEFINGYISYRASMLGVRTNEIIKRLNENYTVSNIDDICNDLLTKGTNINRLPYGINQKTKIQINESAQKPVNPYNGYQIDDSLLELAGLK